MECGFYHKVGAESCYGHGEGGEHRSECSWERASPLQLPLLLSLLLGEGASSRGQPVMEDQPGRW